MLLYNKIYLSAQKSLSVNSKVTNKFTLFKGYQLPFGNQV